jgi:hypothetical protein
MSALLDARPLKRISRFPVLGMRRKAQSIFWHRVDSLPCACRWPHGNCNDFPCACVRHQYDMH